MDNIKRTKNKIAKRKRELENEMDAILPEFRRLISISPSINQIVKTHTSPSQP